MRKEDPKSSKIQRGFIRGKTVKNGCGQICSSTKLIVGLKGYSITIEGYFMPKMLNKWIPLV